MDADILLTNGDMRSNNYGDIDLVGGGDEIIQTAISNILTVHGEIPSDPTRGNMIYNRRIKMTRSGLRQVESDSKNAILQDPRVVDVVYISAAKSDTVPYQCDIQFQIRDIDGNTLSSTTVIILNGG